MSITNWQITNERKMKKKIAAFVHERNDAISTIWTKTICYKISKTVWEWLSTFDVYDFVNCRESFFVVDVLFQT